MDRAKKKIIVVICWDTHDLHPEFAEDCTLFRFGVDVGPHLVCGAVFEHNFTLVDFVFDVEILNLYLFGAFGAACCAVCLK